MNREIKTIGVLTSGGDAPGMNAAVRAVVRVASYYGIKVMGIERGYNGLIHGEIRELSARDMSGIINMGGTMLRTARCPEFKTKEGIEQAVNIAKVFSLDGIVAIGGDGTFRGAKDLCEAGVPTIAVPGTIDNDVASSEYTIGFDTCLNTVVDAVDKLRDTSQSHERCSVIEVMGRHAGYIALESGIATGADVILIPEKEWDFEVDVIRPILEAKQRSKRHAIVIIAEGVGGAMEIAQKIQKTTGIESRTTILGHVQRGGNPSVRDRVMASRFGAKAVELLREGKQNKIVCSKDAEIIDIDIQEGLSQQKSVSQELVDLAKMLAI